MAHLLQLTSLPSERTACRVILVVSESVVSDVLLVTFVQRIDVSFACTEKFYSYVLASELGGCSSADEGSVCRSGQQLAVVSNDSGVGSSHESEQDHVLRSQDTRRKVSVKVKVVASAESTFIVVCEGACGSRRSEKRELFEESN